MSTGAEQVVGREHAVSALTNGKAAAQAHTLAPAT